VSWYSSTRKRLEEQVVEIDGVARGERRLVAAEDLPQLGVARVIALLEVLRPLHLVLGVADATEHRPRLQHPVVDVERAHHLLDGRDLVGRVVDHEVAREADVRRLAAKQAGAHRVEGHHPRALARVAEQRGDAPPHLLGGLVGEGKRDHLVGAGVAAADEVRDAVRDDARLARPGAGQDEQGTLHPQHRLALLGVELIQEFH